MKSLLRLKPYVGRHKLRITGGFIALGLANYFTLKVAFEVGAASDAIKNGGHTHHDFFHFAMVIIALTTIMGVFRYCMRQWIIGASRDIEYAFRNDLFSKLQSLSPAYYDRQRTGDLMAKATSDVDQVRSFLGPGFLQFFNSALLFPLALFRMIQIDGHLTAIIMAPLVSLPFVMNYFGNRVHRRFRNSQDHYSHMSAMVQENLAGARVVKAFVQEDAQEKLFSRLNANFVGMNMDLAAIQSGFYPSLRVLAGFSVMLLLWIGGHDAAIGKLSVGEFVEFTLIQTMLFWPMIALGWTVSLMQRGAASMDRITEILELPSYQQPLTPEQASQFQVQRHEGSDIPGTIEFRNLSFRYGTQLPCVLKNIDLNIPAGHRLGVVGRTGSGKTTLAVLLARLYPVENEMLFIDGQDINTIPMNQLRDRVGIVFQETFLFSESIESNIAFGDPKRGLDEVRRVARVSHIAEEIEEFPRKYDTILGERGINLSGGQKQRTAIARALLRDPGILVLDDALSAVDTETESHILKSLHEELVGRTAIIIAHRVSAVMNCEQIIVMDDGFIAEHGTHDSLIAKAGLYADLYEKQQLSEALELDAG